MKTWQIPTSYIVHNEASSTYETDLWSISSDPTGKYVYFTLSDMSDGSNSGAQKYEAVYQLDTTTGTFKKIAGNQNSARGMGDIQWCNGKVYFLDYDLYSVDPSTGTVTKVQSGFFGRGAYVLECTPTGATPIDISYAKVSYYGNGSEWKKVTLDMAHNMITGYIWDGRAWVGRGSVVTGSNTDGYDRLYVLKDYTCHYGALIENDTGNIVGSCYNSPPPAAYFAKYAIINNSIVIPAMSDSIYNGAAIKKYTVK